MKSILVTRLLSPFTVVNFGSQDAFGSYPKLAFCCVVHPFVSLDDLCALVPHGNHSQIGVGSDAERVRKTMAYGWVERCNDIASCGEASSQDKYSWGI